MRLRFGAYLRPKSLQYFDKSVRRKMIASAYIIVNIEGRIKEAHPPSWFPQGQTKSMKERGEEEVVHANILTRGMGSFGARGRCDGRMGRSQPGGHLSCRPPITWMWRCITLWHPCSPSLTTSLRKAEVLFAID